MSELHVLVQLVQLALEAVLLALEQRGDVAYDDGTEEQALVETGKQLRQAKS